MAQTVRRIETARAVTGRVVVHASAAQHGERMRKSATRILIVVHGIVLRGGKLERHWSSLGRPVPSTLSRVKVFLRAVSKPGC
jgi:hypothetical protein